MGEPPGAGKPASTELAAVNRQDPVDRRLELELPVLPSRPLSNFLNASQVDRVVAKANLRES